MLLESGVYRSLDNGKSEHIQQLQNKCYDKTIIDNMNKLRSISSQVSLQFQNKCQRATKTDSCVISHGGIHTFQGIHLPWAMNL